jgi:hypothetical protein
VRVRGFIPHKFLRFLFSSFFLFFSVILNNSFTVSLL